jgi:SSS family solute:Na+ symporter
MNTIDWLGVILPMAIVLAFALYTNRFVKSVADFLAAGRCAGRYLLANARGESDSGLTNTMARFEMVLVSGFVLSYWDLVSIPVLLLVGISGFVVYRFRQTRALTLAQFFEMRYSRRFRLFMGILAFVSGILNYGIFPAVSSRFFVYFLDLPQSAHIGPIALPTFAIIMLGYLLCTVLILLIGGQVTLMVTDCLEGIFSHLVYIIIVVSMLLSVGWRPIVKVMSQAAPGHSLIDPFDAGQVPDFNFSFAVMATILNIYTSLVLQNRQGFNASARSPHESRMGGVLGQWRMYARTLMLLVLGVCAVTFLRHGDFANRAAPAASAIASITDPYIQKQMTIPVALRYLLPVGVKGLFCSIMIMGLLAGDAAHMHSWGSIFVQDVLLPLRRRPMSETQHIWALRLAMISVAAFAFCFSVLFSQTQYIALWWAITAGMFTGGAGAAIVGGLYWRKGTTAAAWAAAVTGSILALVGIICSSRAWPSIATALAPLTDTPLPQRFWLNYQQAAFLAASAAAMVYISVSYLTCRREFDLDRMLHRGLYADSDPPGHPPRSGGARMKLRNLLSFDQNFTRSDKLIAAAVFIWALTLLMLNGVVSTWNVVFYRWPIQWWSRYWLITAVLVPLVIALATFVWFGIGGIRDIRDFFRALRALKRDDRDDGRVVHTTDVARAAMSGIPPETAAVRAAERN